MNIICPYCNKYEEIKEKEDFLYICHNHPLSTVYIWATKDGNIKYTRFYDKEDKYAIDKFFKENKMKLYYCKGWTMLVALPIDLSLTPENFEHKLKTYLIFQ